MGELIAFKVSKGAPRLNPGPIQPATILFFNGVWRERAIDPSKASKRASGAADKASGKSPGKSRSGRAKDTISK
jgi:hypothetical protein